MAGRLAFSLVFSSAIFASPITASAGVLSFMSNLLSGKQDKTEKSIRNNSQNMPILQATVSPDPNYARGGGDITIVNDSALLPDTGPVGTQADIPDEPENNGQISLYIVRSGDSLGQIAKMFGVSINTIAWTNDIKSGVITPGQKLVILPVSGIQYSVKKGDTVNGIAKKYKADVGEILAFNGLSEPVALKEGDTIIIPDGEQSMPSPLTSKPTSALRGSRGVPDYSGYYIRPISYDDGRKTQGLHGYNGIDIGAPIGTPIMAAASGDILVARSSGWNGGYGKYVVIRHDNGTQTLYGHMNTVVAQEGMRVIQGQIIGYVGNTGRSTGAHLHFEVRGARNPF